jgi:hypothetical protein
MAEAHAAAQAIQLYHLASWPFSVLVAATFLFLSDDGGVKGKVKKIDGCGGFVMDKVSIYFA